MQKIIRGCKILIFQELDDGEREQPLICLMKTSLKDSVTRVLDANAPKVRDWLALQNLAWADFSDQPNAFTNINDPELLEQLSESN